MPNDATILEGCRCRDCGFGVVEINCNIDQKPYNEWDWWQYCSNPICKNHAGEGVFQNEPEWIERTSDLKE